MSYRTDLKWLQDLTRFTPEQRKILLALSNEGYRWRTRVRIIDVTGLGPKDVDSELSKLITEEIVRPSFSKKKEMIFGLRERVDS